MTMLTKYIIIDDEPLAIQIIEGHAAQIADLELVASFQNPMEAFELLRTEKVDLMFLDIEMPLLSGIDFAKTLPNPPKIIFTTAYRNYALESYELDVIDYLLKPIAFNRFFKAYNKFKKRTLQKESTILSENPKMVNDHLYVNTNKKFTKVLFDDILYVESIKDYIRIHTLDHNIITKDKISEFILKLPPHFLRVHRSYLVNTQKISAFTTVDVEIGSIEVPIGDSYKKAVLARLKG